MLLAISAKIFKIFLLGRQEGEEWDGTQQTRWEAATGYFCGCSAQTRKI